MRIHGFVCMSSRFDYFCRRKPATRGLLHESRKPVAGPITAATRSVRLGSEFLPRRLRLPRPARVNHSLRSTSQSPSIDSHALSLL